jgi:hypothetical protein
MDWRALVSISMKAVLLRGGIEGVRKSERVGIGTLIGVLVIGTGTGVVIGRTIDTDDTIDTRFII